MRTPDPRPDLLKWCTGLLQKDTNALKAVQCLTLLHALPANGAITAEMILRRVFCPVQLSVR